MLDQEIERESRFLLWYTPSPLGQGWGCHKPNVSTLEDRHAQHVHPSSFRRNRADRPGEDVDARNRPFDEGDLRDRGLTTRRRPHPRRMRG